MADAAQSREERAKWFREKWGEEPQDPIEALARIEGISVEEFKAKYNVRGAFGSPPPTTTSSQPRPFAPPWHKAGEAVLSGAKKLMSSPVRADPASIVSGVWGRMRERQDPSQVSVLDESSQKGVYEPPSQAGRLETSVLKTGEKLGRVLHGEEPMFWPSEGQGLLTMAGNAPKDVANIAGGIASLVFRSGLAGSKAADMILGQVYGMPWEEIHELRSESKELGQEVLEELGLIALDTIKLPASAYLQPILEIVQPAAAYRMRQAGWTPQQVAEQMQVSPVGTSIFLLSPLVKVGATRVRQQIAKRRAERAVAKEPGTHRVAEPEVRYVTRPEEGMAAEPSRSPLGAELKPQVARVAEAEVAPAKQPGLEFKKAKKPGVKILDREFEKFEEFQKEIESVRQELPGESIPDTARKQNQQGLWNLTAERQGRPDLVVQEDVRPKRQKRKAKEKSPAGTKEDLLAGERGVVIVNQEFPSFEAFLKQRRLSHEDRGRKWKPEWNEKLRETWNKHAEEQGKDHLKDPKFGGLSEKSVAEAERRAEMEYKGEPPGAEVRRAADAVIIDGEPHMGLTDFMAHDRISTGRLHTNINHYIKRWNDAARSQGKEQMVVEEVPPSRRVGSRKAEPKPSESEPAPVPTREKATPPPAKAQGRAPAPTVAPPKKATGPVVDAPTLAERLTHMWVYEKTIRHRLRGVIPDRTKAKDLRSALEEAARAGLIEKGEKRGKTAWRSKSKTPLLRERGSWPSDIVRHPERIWNYIRRNGGMKVGDVQHKTVLENYRGTTVRSMFKPKKSKAKTMEQWADDIKDQYPDDFQSRHEAFEWLKTDATNREVRGRGQEVSHLERTTEREYWDTVMEHGPEQGMAYGETAKGRFDFLSRSADALADLRETSGYRRALRGKIRMYVDGKLKHELVEPGSLREGDIYHLRLEGVEESKIPVEQDSFLWKVTKDERGRWQMESGELGVDALPVNDFTFRMGIKFYEGGGPKYKAGKGLEVGAKGGQEVSLAAEKTLAKQPEKGKSTAPTSFISEDRAKKARESLKKKGSSLKSLPDISAMSEIVQLGIYHAERLAMRGQARFGPWAGRMKNELRGLFEESRVRVKELRRLWGNALVQRARRRAYAFPAHMPGRYGMLRSFEAELGEKRGGMTFDERRLGANRLAAAKVFLEKRHRKEFDAMPLEEHLALEKALQGIPERTPDGKYVYGSYVRAGIRKVKKSDPNQQALEIGELDKFGRFAGEVTDGKYQKLYRIVWPEEASMRHAYLVSKYPRAARLMDKVLANEEPPLFTVMGDRMPGLSRKVAKEVFGIEGLKDAEAKALSEFASKAYGIPRREFANLRFSWIPERAFEPKTTVGRLRTMMRHKKANVRKFKSGEIAERADKERMSFGDALLKTQLELAQEHIQNEVLNRTLPWLLEPMKSQAELTGTKGKVRYYEWSKTGLSESSRLLREHVLRNAAWFEEQGVKVPDVVKASYMAGGRAWKINATVLEQLDPRFRKRKVQTTVEEKAKVFDALDDAAAAFVAVVNLSRLTRISTANRNFLSNTVLYSGKILRDFYKGAIRAALSNEVLPMQEFVSDIRAIGAAFHPKTIKRLPREMLGATFLDAQSTGLGAGTTRALATMLRYNGFQAWDVYTKRVLYEAVLDAQAKRAWAYAKKFNETRGLTKDQFIRNFKTKDIPPEVEALAYREMDLWGGYDYGNIPPKLQQFRGSKVGRAIIPYPTFFYKYMQTWRELFGVHNLRTILGVERMPMGETLGSALKFKKKKYTLDQRAQAYANVLAGSTLLGIAAMVYSSLGPPDDLPEGVKESDLSYDVQRFGRLRLPDSAQWVFGKSDLPDDEKDIAWIRLYDIPFIGEVMMVNEIFRGNYTLMDYLMDRMPLGPLFNTVAIVAGLQTNFNRELTRSSRLGREMASWIPWHPEIQTARRYLDRWKRDVSSEDRSAFVNWIAPFMDQTPGLSMLLPKRADVYRWKRPIFNPWEVTMSYGVLNTRTFSKADRDLAVLIAHLDNLHTQEKELEKKVLFEQLDKVINEVGESLASRMRKAWKMDRATLESKRQGYLYVLEAKKAWLDTEGWEERERAGREAYKKLEATAHEDIKERSPDLTEREIRWAMSQAKRYAENDLKKMRAREAKGLERTVIESAPRRLRGKVAEEQKKDLD